ncbi:hypothetical protein [Sphingopyxis sp. EG6]|jgi:uncharacterized membrane protein|uniref:hypothetical protein n=1 Tax=Sphingopyxis sp. EG6 TaxID=1874061 RepID=UPI000DC629B3|nr:hypothetical protein [Sphingopyxis sp. EG6]BBB08771.1 putative transmembrane protein [Sphingopyxis sp. EG6]
MKIVGALLTIGCGGLLVVGSAIFGALMLTSANGPTRGNWIAHYALTYAVPAIIILICLYILVRLFR